MDEKKSVAIKCGVARVTRISRREPARINKYLGGLPGGILHVLKARSATDLSCSKRIDRREKK